jgi:phosphoribosylamine--glycine ligase
MYFSDIKPPNVLKADGLAAGKGVLIIHDLAEAKEELRNMLVHQKFCQFKSSNRRILDGIELSCFVLTDGKVIKILPTAKITNALAKATLD